MPSYVTAGEIDWIENRPGFVTVQKNMLSQEAFRENDYGHIKLK